MALKIAYFSGSTALLCRLITYNYLATEISTLRPIQIPAGMIYLAFTIALA